MDQFFFFLPFFFCLLLHKVSVAFLTSLHVEVCNICRSFFIITGKAFKVICHLPSLLSCLSTTSSEKDQQHKPVITGFFFTPMECTDPPKLVIAFNARKPRLKPPPLSLHYHIYVAASNNGRKRNQQRPDRYGMGLLCALLVILYQYQVMEPCFVYLHGKLG